jgi:hypothetical protein
MKLLFRIAELCRDSMGGRPGHGRQGKLHHPPRLGSITPYRTRRGRTRHDSVASHGTRSRDGPALPITSRAPAVNPNRDSRASPRSGGAHGHDSSSHGRLQFSDHPTHTMVYTASFAFFEALWEYGVSHVFVNLGSDHPSIIEAIVKGQNEKKGQFPKIITCPNEVGTLDAPVQAQRLTGPDGRPLHGGRIRQTDRQAPMCHCAR